MIVGPPAHGPAELAILLPDRHFINAGVPLLHQSVFGELPILIAIGSTIADAWADEVASLMPLGADLRWLRRARQAGLADLPRALRAQPLQRAGILRQILASQALSLDAMFTELARRGALNIGEYLDASDRYMRSALKAQRNCRATLEALAKLHQPREQTVRHVHVNEGGQAVVADHFHHHTGAAENGKSVKQSDATDAAGASPPMPCPNTGRNRVPISGRERQAAMQNARRHQSGGT